MITNVNTPEGTESTKKPKDSQNAEDAWTLGFGQHQESDIDQRYEHEKAVHDIPTALQIGVLTDEKTFCQHLANDNIVFAICHI